MAHTFDNKARLTGTATTLTTSYTCGSGTTLLTVAIVNSIPTNFSPARNQYINSSPVMYNNIGLSAVYTEKTKSDYETSVELWYLTNPPIGTYTLQISNPNNVPVQAVISSYKAQAGYSTILVDWRYDYGATANPSILSVSWQSGDVIIAVVGSGADAWAPTGRTGIQLYDVDNGNFGDGTQYYIPTSSGSGNIGWTFSTADDWQMLLGVFREVQPAQTSPINSIQKFSLSYNEVTGAI